MKDGLTDMQDPTKENCWPLFTNIYFWLYHIQETLDVIQIFTFLFQSGQLEADQGKSSFKKLPGDESDHFCTNLDFSPNFRPNHFLYKNFHDFTSTGSGL